MIDWQRVGKFALIAFALFGAVSGTSGCALGKSETQHRSTAPKQQAPMNAASSNANAAWSLEDRQPVLKQTPSNAVRGVYVSSHVARSRRIQEIIDLIDKTELNAIVMDINSGFNLTVLPASASDRKFRLSESKSSHTIQALVSKLKKRQIYMIARVVTFKNPELVHAVPSWAIKRKNGKVWTDKSGTAWIDPYRQEAWEYPLAVAEHAAKLGFDEVQFDYVRFPENEAKVDREVRYANAKGWTKSETIKRFLHRAAVRSHKHKVKVSADVFGMVGSSDDDMGIGQKWDAIAREVDVISPMIYPSHYSRGMWGIANPDLTPGPIIARALKDSARQNRKLNGQGIATAKVRPWLQGFTAGWIHPHQKYGPAQIKEQILAARKAGVQSYLIWNSSNRYPKFST